MDLKDRKLNLCDRIIFVDAYAKQHEALVTAIWKNEYQGMQLPWGVNVVFVSDEENRTDNYGRQIVHETSVCHKSVQPAHGVYWMFPDEEPRPIQ